MRKRKYIVVDYILLFQCRGLRWAKYSLEPAAVEVSMLRLQHDLVYII